MPDDAEAKLLQPGYKLHEPDQIAQRQEQKKEQRTHEVFDEECRKYPVASLFSTHEFLTAKKSPVDFKNELIRLYAEEVPKAKVISDVSPEAGIEEIFFDQSSPNPLAPARREMLVVIGKGKGGQTQVIFKLFEYEKRSAGSLVDIFGGSKNPDNWIPLHPSRIEMIPEFEEQITIGYHMMMRKVMKAVGETFD